MGSNGKGQMPSHSSISTTPEIIHDLVADLLARENERSEEAAREARRAAEALRDSERELALSEMRRPMTNAEAAEAVY